MERQPEELKEMIASQYMFVCEHIHDALFSLLLHSPNEVVIEVFRISSSVLASRIDPEECDELEGFIAAHRKVLGLFLESLDGDE